MSTGPSIQIGERVISQDSLRAEATRVASALVDAGVERGERIAIVLRNDPVFPMLSLATGLIGAVPVPVNWHWRGDELRHVLTDSGSRIAFAHSTFVEAVERVLPDGVPLIEVPVSDELAAAYGPDPITGRHELLEDWFSRHDPISAPQAASPLSLIYTSGTTGFAKGVIRSAMTPEQSTQVATATLAGMGLKPGMSTIVTAPMYHAAPNAQTLFAVALGIEMTIMPRFSPEEFLRLVQEQRITHAQMVPTMFVRLLELTEEVRDALRHLQSRGRRSRRRPVPGPRQATR